MRALSQPSACPVDRFIRTNDCYFDFLRSTGQLVIEWAIIHYAKADIYVIAAPTPEKLANIPMEVYNQASSSSRSVARRWRCPGADITSGSTQGHPSERKRTQNCSGRSWKYLQPIKSVMGALGS